MSKKSAKILCFDFSGVLSWDTIEWKDAEKEMMNILGLKKECIEVYWKVVQRTKAGRENRPFAELLAEELWAEEQSSRKNGQSIFENSPSTENELLSKCDGFLREYIKNSRINVELAEFISRSRNGLEPNQELVIFITTNHYKELSTYSDLIFPELEGIRFNVFNTSNDEYPAESHFTRESQNVLMVNSSEFQVEKQNPEYWALVSEMVKKLSQTFDIDGIMYVDDFERHEPGSLKPENIDEKKLRFYEAIINSGILELKDSSGRTIPFLVSDFGLKDLLELRNLYPGIQRRGETIDLERFISLKDVEYQRFLSQKIRERFELMLEVYNRLKEEEIRIQIESATGIALTTSTLSQRRESDFSTRIQAVQGWAKNQLQQIHEQRKEKRMEPFKDWAEQRDAKETVVAELKNRRLPAATEPQREVIKR